MITTAEEYLKALWLMNNNGNTPIQVITVPSTEPIYEIDLTSRTIKSPTFLSVAKDHTAETIYFITDRMFGETDLATTTCVVQYINAAGEGRFYPVPFLDAITYSGTEEQRYVKAYVIYSNYEKGKYYVLKEDGTYEMSYDAFDENESYYSRVDQPKILIPWVIEGPATKAAGPVQYSIRFYKVDDLGQNITYNLNTKPATSKVLAGIDDSEMQEAEDAFAPTELEKIYSRLTQLELEKEIYWIEA